VSAHIENRDRVLEILNGIFATNSAEHWSASSNQQTSSQLRDMHGVLANPTGRLPWGGGDHEDLLTTRTRERPRRAACWPSQRFRQSAK